MPLPANVPRRRPAADPSSFISPTRASRPNVSRLLAAVRKAGFLRLLTVSRRSVAAIRSLAKSRRRASAQGGGRGTFAQWPTGRYGTSRVVRAPKIGPGAGRQCSVHVGRDALVGEIKEEGAAAGRPRGTFAGKGIAPQRQAPAPLQERITVQVLSRHKEGKRTKKKPGTCPGFWFPCVALLSQPVRSGRARCRTCAASPPAWCGAGRAVGRHGRLRPGCVPAPR